MVSAYSLGRTVSSRSLTNDGLLCAAELKAINVTRLTFMSGSVRALKN